jgi:hypothetical protein
MRYEFTDEEWAAIKAMLPNEPRGIPRVNDRRVSMASSGSYDPEHLGATYLKRLVPHHLLQPLRSLAASGRLEPDHRCTRRCP